MEWMYEPGFTTIRFCQERNNNISHKRGGEQDSACQNCDYQQEADNRCLYVNKITQQVNKLTQIIKDVSQDLILPRPLLSEDET
uniref:Uncharacterized protein n=1 Tax=Dromaius novaehollandiae TaxID=8790 RepID=A0A8C4KFL3_DRONO